MKQFDVRLITFILFHLLRECIGKEIFVSQSIASNDDETCGSSFRNPCCTIAFALSKIQHDGYTVRIDGGENLTSPYVYLINEVIKLNHSIVLEKWEHDNEIISPKPILSKHNESAKFNVFGNITFVSIEFHSNSPGWVFVKTSCTKIHITNCLFESHNGDTSDIIGLSSRDDFDLHVGKSKVKISDVEYGLSSFVTMKRHDNQIIYLLYNSRITGHSFQIMYSRRIVINRYSVYISNCNFKTNYVDIVCTHLVVQNSTFKSGVFSVTTGRVNVTNCVFDDTTVKITAGMFMTGFLPSFIYNTTFQNRHPKQRLPSTLTLRSDEIFRTDIVLIRCSFRNNTLFKPNSASSLSILVFGSVQLHDCEFEASRNNEIVIQSRYGISQFSNTTVTCKDWDFVHNSRSQITCKTCKESTYRFREKTLLTNDFSHQPCRPCPYNAICLRANIRLKGGYWGYVDTRKGYINTLSLLTCPAYYCCPSIEQCTSYSTCAKHRTGRLCSQCKPGYSSDMSAKYQCTPNSQCHNAKITFVLYIFLAVMFIVLLLYLKEIILFVKTITKSRGNEHSAENEDAVFEEDERLQLQERLLHESVVVGDSRPPSPYQILHTNDMNTEIYRNTSSYLISGSLKILFFSYQAAALIRIQSVDKIELMFPKFFDFVSTAFNIKLHLSRSSMTICILPDINVIQAKIIKLGFIFTVSALIIILWAVTCACKTARNLNKPSTPCCENTYTQIDDDVPSYCKLPFIVRVKCVYVQFLLTAYASIATFCFDTVHCVDINGESYLFTQASIKCYQPWQYGAFAFIALWVVPFALSLYFSTKLLYRCSINPTQFLLMLSFPPAMLCLLVKRKRQQLRQDEAMLSKQLLLVVNEPFRESTIGDGSKLCWETVLILRRMLLVIAQTFIMTPMIKLSPMALLLLVFVFHHKKMKSFSDTLLNDIEFASLLVLLSLVFVNMLWAFTWESGIMKSSTYRVYGKVAMFYEMFILSLPFILLVFYMLYKLFRILRRACKHIYNIMRYKQD